MQSITPYYGRAIINEMLVGLVDRSEHALLTAGGSETGLDSLAAQLTALRSRVLRPSTTGALTLPGLLAQIAGLASSETLGAPDLEWALELLSNSGPDCDRVVLLLDRADALDPAALRYLQMLIREAPLRLLFVGGPRFYGLLMQQEFTGLRDAFVTFAIPAPIVVESKFLVPAAASPAAEAFAGAA